MKDEGHTLTGGLVRSNRAWPVSEREQRCSDLFGRELHRSKALVPVTFSLRSANTTATNTQDPGVFVCVPRRAERHPAETRHETRRISS